MPRSSESVAALASALAKAQVELTNPEKSLTARLPADRSQPERTFRYASLAGGLDIVRKALGRHEIATIQSTAIDHDSRTIKLTTTLAHASGEWIASDWPVCALTDLPAPHRMGSALSYARRYALFTLVGIAGEDDLDAPDLPFRPEAPGQTSAPSLSPEIPTSAPEVSSKGSIPIATSRAVGRHGTPKPPVTLEPELSERRRDELMADLTAIQTIDDAAEWAKRIIPAKNALTSEHAREIEAAFEAKLAQVDRVFERIELAPIGKEKEVANEASGSPAKEPHKQRDITDRSTLTFGHLPRRRSKEHLRFVASKPCLLCGRSPSDAHHLRFAPGRAFGRKVSDEFTVPLCRTHHRQLHQTGNEQAWWAEKAPNIDPLKVAAELWNLANGGSLPPLDTT